MKSRHLKLGFLPLLPLLMAPVCAHSILPTFPTNVPNYPANPTLAQIAASQRAMEPLLVDAHANSLLALGIPNWDALEPCVPCFGFDCYVNYPAGVPGGEHVEPPIFPAYKCNFNFATLDQYLAIHADPSANRSARRHFMIQLAPIFTKARTVPGYLKTTAFDSPTMINKYHRLIDWVLPVLAKHVNGPSDPIVAVGLGNEVNAYMSLQPDPIAAYNQYETFVRDASSYLHSKWTAPTTLFTTVTTTYYGFCGAGDIFWSVNGCPNVNQYNKAIELMSLTDMLSFTYYPQANDNPNLASTVGLDMQLIYTLAFNANKWAILQEAGYPADGFTNTQSTQTAVVNALYSASETFASKILAVNYFPLTDFPQWLGTAFFYDTGAVKSQTAWNNFKTQNAPNNCNINSNACCSKSCVDASSSLQCSGASSCSSLPGGAAACCPSTIQSSHRVCDALSTNAPCITNCNASVCCATTCVDGAGNLQCNNNSSCAGLSGGSAACCQSAITSSNRHCDGDPSRAPCIR